MEDIQTLTTSHSRSNGRRTRRLATVHRVRFIEFNPSSITAIALTPSTWDPCTSGHYPYASQRRELLAVSRQDGQIEIYTWIGTSSPPVNRESQSHTRKKKQRRQGNKQGWVLERVRLAHRKIFFILNRERAEQSAPSFLPLHSAWLHLDHHA